MEYTTLGGTGMTVSRICLGCMSFGTPEWREWVLDESDSREIIERAIELGINFFDTANIYSRGESERVLGNVLDDYERDEQVIATKVYNQMDEDDPNSGGLSRKTIEQELQNSLDRLGMDTIDLYQVHRYDEQTDIEETLSALDDTVRRNQVRYVGASSMWARQFQRALYESDRLGLERYVTMQNHYNLVYREEEREMLPLCLEEDVGVIPWSPLARGFLTRPHDELDQTERGTAERHQERGTSMYEHPYTERGGIEVNERVAELATEKGATMAQIALAWLLHKEWVDAPIVGTTSVEHLEEAVAALDISLSDAEMDYLEAPYEPVPVSPTL